MNEEGSEYSQTVLQLATRNSSIRGTLAWGDMASLFVTRVYRYVLANSRSVTTGARGVNTSET